MGVLSVTETEVWQGDTASIRTLLAACEADYGPADWIARANWSFEIGVKHFELGAEPNDVARQVASTARNLARSNPEDTGVASFQALADLIERTRLDAPRPSRP